jgi:PKD repeat protein
MYKKRTILIFACILFSVIASTCSAADFPPFPGFPHSFCGTVTNQDGSATPDGTIIAAFVDNETYYTTAINGSYGFNETAQASNAPFFVEDPENNNEGKTIYFFIGGIHTSQTTVYINGGNTHLNLVLPAGESDGGNDGTTEPPGGTATPGEKIPPTANAHGPYLGVVDRPVYFDASRSNDSDGHIIQYMWDFGDVNTSSGISPTHTYTKPGVYTILLTVTDNDNLADSDTTLVSIANDSDGDEWSDEEENQYHTNPEGSLEYPIDTDGDFIPDSVDTDDDNDGIVDSEELRLGSDPTDNTDVIFITYQGMILCFVDTNGDTQPDLYYNKTTLLYTSLAKSGDAGFYNVDIDDDGVWEYTYNAAQGSISPYAKSLDPALMMMLVIGIIVVLTFLGFISLFMYKKNKKRRKK